MQSVHSQNQLREKAYIFDIGLDDRVVEIMKVMTVAHLSQTNPDLEVGDIFLEITKGKPERFVIRLKNGVLGNSHFPRRCMMQSRRSTLIPRAMASGIISLI